MKQLAKIFLLSTISITVFAGNTGSMSYGPLASAVPVMNSLTTAALALILSIIAYRVLRSRNSSTTKSLLAAVVISGTVYLSGNALISKAVAVSIPELSNPAGGEVPVFGSVNNVYQNTSGVDLSIGDVTPPFECAYPVGASSECIKGYIVEAGSSCSINCTLAPSDLRLKHDIRYLKSTKNGLKLYAFKYIWSEQVYVGVMAQDLLKNERYRDAVTQMPGGYYAVDYGKLGFQMTTLENW